MYTIVYRVKFFLQRTFWNVTQECFYFKAISG